MRWIYSACGFRHRIFASPSLIVVLLCPKDLESGQAFITCRGSVISSRKQDATRARSAFGRLRTWKRV